MRNQSSIKCKEADVKHNQSRTSEYSKFITSKCRTPDRTNVYSVLFRLRHKELNKIWGIYKEGGLYGKASGDMMICHICVNLCHSFNRR